MSSVIKPIPPRFSVVRADDHFKVVYTATGQQIATFPEREGAEASALWCDRMWNANYPYINRTIAANPDSERASALLAIRSLRIYESVLKHVKPDRRDYTTIKQWDPSWLTRALSICEYELLEAVEELLDSAEVPSIPAVSRKIGVPPSRIGGRVTNLIRKGYIATERETTRIFDENTGALRHRTDRVIHVLRPWRDSEPPNRKTPVERPQSN